MTIQTLIVTMNQTGHGLLEQMNIQTPAIVGNQCGHNAVEEFEYRGHGVKWLSFAERGVGLNRNNILMRSTADICVFADDDMIFKDGYADTVTRLFTKYPDVDVLIFNLDEKNPKRYKIQKPMKINKTNYGKYGAARMAIRRERVFLKNIFFHLQFGGGAKYSSGEDSIFLYDCLDRGLRVLAVPDSLAELTDDRPSTWFVAYNERVFFDKGILYALLYKERAYLVGLYNCWSHRNGRYREYGWRKAYRDMCAGIRTGRK